MTHFPRDEDIKKYHKKGEGIKDYKFATRIIIIDAYDDDSWSEEAFNDLYSSIIESLEDYDLVVAAVHLEKQQS